MRLEIIGHQYRVILLLSITSMVVGCGEGSAASGGGSSFAAEPMSAFPVVGAIPVNTLSPIQQSGTYELPAVGFLTDIQITNCVGASADALAASATTNRTFTMNCVTGPTNVVDFPGGGGEMTINLNAGGPITIFISEAQSLQIGNR